jgi:hypothetical protein
LPVLRSPSSHGGGDADGECGSQPVRPWRSSPDDADDGDDAGSWLALLSQSSLDADDADDGDAGSLRRRTTPLLDDSLGDDALGNGLLNLVLV